MKINKQDLEKIRTSLLEKLPFFPKEKQEQIKNTIKNTNDEEFEEFIIANKLLQTGEEEKQQTSDENCIFCKIIKKQIPSHIIQEDEDYLTILELNPLSKGHALILPKKHIPKTKLTQKDFDFAKKIQILLQEKLTPKEVGVIPSEVLEHAVINLIPKYDKEINGERYKASEEELIQIEKKIKQEPIKIKEEKKEIKIEKKESEKIKIPKLKPRLP
jgi:histidine triad (HIT) family protein